MDLLRRTGPRTSLADAPVRQDRCICPREQPRVSRRTAGRSRRQAQLSRATDVGIHANRCMCPALQPRASKRRCARTRERTPRHAFRFRSSSATDCRVPADEMGRRARSRECPRRRPHASDATAPDSRCGSPCRNPNMGGDRARGCPSEPASNPARVRHLCRASTHLGTSSAGASASFRETLPGSGIAALNRGRGRPPARSGSARGRSGMAKPYWPSMPQLRAFCQNGSRPPAA